MEDPYPQDEEDDDAPPSVRAESAALTADNNRDKEEGRCPRSSLYKLIGVAAILVFSVVAITVGVVLGLQQKNNNDESHPTDSSAVPPSTPMPTVVPLAATLTPTVSSSATTTTKNATHCNNEPFSTTESLYNVTLTVDAETNLSSDAWSQLFFKAYYKSLLHDNNGTLVNEACSPEVLQVSERPFVVESQKRLLQGDEEPTNDTSVISNDDETQQEPPPTTASTSTFTKTIAFVITTRQVESQTLVLDDQLTLALNETLMDSNVSAAVTSVELESVIVLERPLQNATTGGTNVSTIAEEDETGSNPIISDHNNSTNCTTTETTNCEGLPPTEVTFFDIPGTCQEKAETWLTQTMNHNPQASTHDNGTITNSSNSNNSNNAIMAVERIQQRYALAVLYCELDGENWQNNTNTTNSNNNNHHDWLSPDTHECDWPYPSSNDYDNDDGVCFTGSDGFRWYQRLRWNGPHLRGTLPVELSLLTHLRELNISHGRIQGSIPQEYSSLTDLEALVLASNGDLEGSIPDFVWNRPDMMHLDLSNNHLVGTLPSNLHRQEPNLKNLLLSNNELFGTIPFEPFVTLALEQLHLNGNSLIGSIFSELNVVKLQELLLHSNNLSGEIPTNILEPERAPQLRVATFYDNDRLTGVLDAVCPVLLEDPTAALEILQVDLNNVLCQCCQAADEPVLETDSDNDNEDLEGEDGNIFDHDTDVEEEEEEEEDEGNTVHYIPFGIADGLVPDNVRTTPLDPYLQGDCDFSDNLQPHVISQCECNGEIYLIADDIKVLYTVLKTELMPHLYTQEGTMWEEPITSCNAQNQALLWLSSGDTRQSGDLVQRFVLSTAYLAMNGTKWDYQNLWLSDQNECLWLGLGCDKDFQIVSVALDTINIFGKLPSEIHLLQGLTTLSITRSHLTGTIPTYLFSLPSVQEIYLNANQLTGGIPTEVGLATSLEALKVESNWMYGTLVSELGLLNNLEHLSLGSNQFIRVIPSEFGMMTQLTALIMEDNRISGTWPTAIGQLTALEKLLMTENLMTGSLPTEVSFMTSMKEMRLAKTGMHGTIPTEIGLLTDLWRLDLGENLFSGTLVTELGQLSNLYFLSLMRNDITGTIPTHFGQLTNMTRLDMQEMRLSGTLPSEIGLMDLLKDFSLNENLITGTVPREICELRDVYLEKFIVDCPNQNGGGVGTFSAGAGDDELLDIEGNCFTICRRGL